MIEPWSWCSQGYDVWASHYTLTVYRKSAAETPFGGTKEPGYGKESGKGVAINEYVIIKSTTLMMDEKPAAKANT
jgi:acyl-CoA reductase-like NAD-dependent aldehyde dehydrogenase